MTDRPIIFSGPMVRALLAGRKTQTRRLATSPLRRCAVGDRLYVRESYAIRGIFSDVVEVGYSASERQSHTEYVEQIPINCAIGARVTWPKARPSIHMPRWASRLTLIVEAVRVQLLTEISEPDARAEGVNMAASRNFALGYAVLWNSLHAAVGQRWDDNPAVVALTFRVECCNIDRIEE
jgi:hypothetical protein